jgi:putative aldouronate transport system substrate-binding protein
MLVVTMLLTACTPAAEPTKAAEATALPEPTKAAEATAVTEPTKAAEATAVPEPTQEPLKPVELTWILDGNGTPEDAPLVMEALNNLPQVKALNVKVNIVWYDWGSYDQKTQLMFTSGEPCDLIFTSNWANNYVNGAINGNYVVLDDLLPKYAPKIWAEVSKVAWTMSKIQGKIYAIPNQQIWYNAWGWSLRKDMAEKYGVTLDTIDSYDDFTPIMEKMLVDYPELKYQMVQGGGPIVAGPMGYDGVPGGVGVIKQGDTSRKIINMNEEPIYREHLQLVHEWKEKGYASQEVVEYDAANAARKNGFYPVYLHVEKPGFAAENKMMNGYDWIGEPLEKPVLGYVIPTMTGVCSTSKNPERALMFFDLMYSDEVVYNTVAKGIEGKHWVWVDKEKKVIGFPEGVDTQNSGYNINTDWMIGNNFLAYYLNPEQVGAWEQTAKINKEAVLPMPGPFIFDPTPVQAEMAALTTVDEQYGDPLTFGLVDLDDPTKGLEAWVKAQKGAGIEKIIAEEQKQLDAFVAANPDIFK